jgi:DNA helicase-2/ATP-dependent DNA helicase PcrA
MPPPIVAEELALLEHVLAALDRGPAHVGPSGASARRELEHLREQLLSGRGATDRAALIDEYHRQSALLEHVSGAARPVPVARTAPYFGHLRLRENGEEWDVCLGNATFVDGAVRIVDWRHAPISRLFYRYGQGETYEEEIAGRTRSGTLAARRLLTIRDARLQRIEAPEGVFRADAAAPEGWAVGRREPPRLAGGEAAALAMYRAEALPARRLGTAPGGPPMRADKHLPDIAALIDPTQFALITQPTSGAVVIRGTAGSGKTTVALHRIAYLAYEDPSFDSRQSLVVVFSRALRDYVSHVLPALGVRRVRVLTFHEWALEQRRRLFPTLALETRDDAPAVVQKLMHHPAMLRALAEQVARVPGRRSAAQAIDDWGSALGQGDFLAGVFARVAADAVTPGEIERASDWCRRRHMDLVAALAGEAHADVTLTPADDALLLRAWQLCVGPIVAPDGRPLRLRHVAIDEVQDFSPLEVRVLLDCLDERRSVTLAGDTQQHVLQDAGFSSWDDFFRHLELAGTEISTLRVSYRSTHEIVTLARAVLGELREDDAPPQTTRGGPPVELFRFSDHGAAVAFLAEALTRLATDEPLASVAVLTPTPELSALYAGGLRAAEVPRVEQVRDQAFRFAPGIEVTEVAQVKGLEFDYVVLVEVSTTHYPDTPQARRLLHVGATRAIHQLWLTSIGTPAAPLRSVLAQQDGDGAERNC